MVFFSNCPICENLINYQHLIKNISLFKDWFIELFQILSLSNDENNIKINFMLAKLFVLFSNNNDDKNKKKNMLSDLIGKIKINPNFQWTSEDLSLIHI